MSLRRDVSGSLLRVWGNTNVFLDMIRSHIEAGRLKKKDAEKVVIQYNEDPYRLYERLCHYAER